MEEDVKNLCLVHFLIKKKEIGLYWSNYQLFSLILLSCLYDAMMIAIC